MNGKSGGAGPNIFEAMEREKARLLQQAAAVERDMAELQRLAAKYDLVVSQPGAAPQPLVEATYKAPELILDLIQYYRTHDKSPYSKLTYASRGHYDAVFKMIEADHGGERISMLSIEDLEGWYRAWSAGGKLAGAYAKIKMVRLLFGFGTEVLQDNECGRLYGMLSKFKTKPPKSRRQKLERDQAEKICATARAMGRPSLALAMAFQFDGELLQKDVIGEWVPMSDPAMSSLVADEYKWIRGIRWTEIDDNFVLHHDGNTWQADIVFDLRTAQLISKELKAQFGVDMDRDSRSSLPLVGPIVVNEYDQLPWDAMEFRRWWRKVADAAGLPKEVRSTDGRERHTASHDDDDESEGEAAFELRN
jgi:hypothetical protein